MMDFSAFPHIETKRLILRRMNPADAGDLFEMKNDPGMHEHTDTKPDTVVDETMAYIDKLNKGIDENKWIIWTIEHKQSGKAIGTISIWNFNSERDCGELGFGIASDYQGQGLMKEALTSVIEYGFTGLSLKALEAYTEEKNLKSIRLLERCHFFETGRADDAGCLHDRVYHMLVYRLENAE